MDNSENINNNKLSNEEITQTMISGFWSERIMVVTDDYEVTGEVFMPKTGRKNRVLSDILNGKKRFVAIKDAVIVHRQNENRKTETHDFIQINLDSIILLRPVRKDSIV